MQQFLVSSGTPSPLGATPNGMGINFALFSPEEKVELALFEPGAENPFQKVPMDRSGDIWHIHIENLPTDLVYAYRIKEVFVRDPYAKMLNTGHLWGEKKGAIFGEVPPPTDFNWEGDTPLQIPFEDLIIYEMHVRGFTQNASSRVKHSGTFLGMLEKIPHLQELGITAVELLPIFEFDETSHPGEHLFNYWGYSTLNFFTPMNRYSIQSALDEFRTLVKALHKAGIEVILDVVFNHVDDRGSMAHIAPSTYFILDDKGGHTNYTGCGNTVNSNNPIVVDWILSSLRYWVQEMHVDGFRFDLASIFYRGENGEVLENPPLLEAINQDPILSKVKLIAEPWDCGGLYQVGSFSPTWAEWNGHFRDTVRSFLKGTDGQAGSFAGVLSGSHDLFKEKTSPSASINFVTAHDGFTLRDLVSYNEKHNEDNGEENRDGNNWNESWNCGHEGGTDDPEILHLRERQTRNFLTALCLSIGTPMLHMGDEYGHTRGGNNNGYCQDNEKNHFLWDALEKNRELFHFFKEMIALRKSRFPKDGKIEWQRNDWSHESRCVAYTIGDLFVAFNAYPIWTPIPLPDTGKMWKRIVDTNFLHFDKNREAIAGEYHLAPYSALILLAE